eukprot:2072476-Rhodomonas_salina.2
MSTGSAGITRGREGKQGGEGATSDGLSACLSEFAADLSDFDADAVEPAHGEHGPDDARAGALSLSLLLSLSLPLSLAPSLSRSISLARSLTFLDGRVELLILEERFEERRGEGQSVETRDALRLCAQRCAVLTRPCVSACVSA